MAGKLRVTLVRSVVSHTARTRGTVRALGLHRIGETVEIADTPQMRGMTRAVRFLLSTEEVGGANEAATRPAPAATPTAAEAPVAANKPTEPKATTKATTKASTKGSTAAAKPDRARTSAKAAAAAQEPAAAPPKAPARSRAKKEESQS